MEEHRQELIGGGYWGGEAKIYNCYNKGTIISTGKDDIFSVAGGIYGYMENPIKSLDIFNCYNVGEIDSFYSRGSIIAIIRGIKPNINNCYYLNQKYENEYELTIPCTDEFLKSTEFVLNLNQFIENNIEKIDTIGWTRWVLSDEGYPTLDFDSVWNGSEFVNKD